MSQCKFDSFVKIDKEFKWSSFILDLKYDLIIFKAKIKANATHKILPPGHTPPKYVCVCV